MNDREALIDALWNFMAPGIRQLDGDRKFYGEAIDLIIERSGHVEAKKELEEIANGPGEYGSSWRTKARLALSALTIGNRT